MTAGLNVMRSNQAMSDRACSPSSFLGLLYTE
jgi:hypothetical protein